jgi:hypothetical protein
MNASSCRWPALLSLLGLAMAVQAADYKPTMAAAGASGIVSTYLMTTPSPG